jgi:hypothetical protein
VTPGAGSGSRIGLVLAGIALAAGALALWFFPRAFPLVALEQRMTRQLALQRADSFFRARNLAPATSRTAVRFGADDSLLTFIDLAGGGKDTLDAIVRGKDVAPFTWSVRAFAPLDPHEARVHFAPDGRITGFRRDFAEADARPALPLDSAQRLAEQVLSTWLGEPLARWRPVTSSYVTRKTSGRIDRTFTYERSDRKLGGAPIRVDLVIAGDTPSMARSYVVIPETFRRRYGEMRSSNDLLALIAVVGMLAIGIVGAVMLRRYAKEGRVRWRAPLVVGGVIGALLIGSGLNEIPSSWYGYDTATSPAVFEAMILAEAILAGALMGAVVWLTLAAAEAATRDAFPAHLDWWKLWVNRGTREVAARVAGGYTVAAIGFAYVALFYIVTRNLLGWWVPSELLDDPNQIATPMPWLAGIAVSLQAGVWEEALFRALPLSLISLWVGTRPNRTAWMAAGIAASALVFGFAHSNYPSWPPYSRGVEIFFDACFWGVLFVNFGLIVTVIAHFVYDLVLFGLFTASGTAPEYRVSAAIILLALLAPAIAVAWKWMRERSLTTAGEDARFAAWRPESSVEIVRPPARRTVRSLGPRARMIAQATAAAGVLVALLAPNARVLGPRFTANRTRVALTADSVVRSHAVDPSKWKRLVRTASDTLDAWPRFLREHDAGRMAGELATTYAIPAWWVVRYVRTEGALADRAEEWRVRLHPDGSPLDVRHILPEGARRDSVSPSEARRIARSALAGAGLDSTRLAESNYEEKARPARLDVTVTYTDSTVKLPAGALARVWVSLAGTEPILVRRGVELPEQFVRADRDKQERRRTVSVFCMLLLVLGLVGGAIYVVREKQPLVDDGAIGRRTMVALIAVLAVTQMASSLNSLPLVLFQYDTAIPWSTFTGSTGIGIVLGGVLALILAGLWLVVTALRRRVGIPVLPDAEGGARTHDAFFAGLALGTLPVILERALSLATTHDIPDVPTTTLDQLVPALAQALGVPMAVGWTIAMIGIPALVIAGTSRRRGVTILLAVILLGLVAGLGATEAYRVVHPTVGAILIGLAAPVAVFLAIRTWGSVCAWSWVIAALTWRGLTSAHIAVHAVAPSEHAAGAIGVTLCLALMLAVVRRIRTVPA